MIFIFFELLATNIFSGQSNKNPTYFTHIAKLRYFQRQFIHLQLIYPPLFLTGICLKTNILTVRFNNRQPFLPIDEFRCFDVFFTVGANESRLAVKAQIELFYKSRPIDHQLLNFMVLTS